ncbi:MAG: ribonuclease P protein component [Clostridiales bacterium]|nr:ribonuclease P protein component [Clostridiales bacterium]
MLPKKYRLRQRRDFRRVYQKGRSQSFPYFVFYNRYTGLPGFRVGFSVSKKIGKAVVRNRVKRQLREICRRHLNKFLAGRDYIIVVRSTVLQADFDKLSCQMDLALTKLREKKQK